MKNDENSTGVTPGELGYFRLLRFLREILSTSAVYTRFCFFMCSVCLGTGSSPFGGAFLSPLIVLA